MINTFVMLSHKTLIVIAVAIGIIAAIVFIVIFIGVIRQSTNTRTTERRIQRKPEDNRSKYSWLSERLRQNLNFPVPTYDIQNILSIPNSSDKIVLFDYSHHFQNVLRCHEDGSLVWVADLPTIENDVYQFIGWNQHGLEALSYTGYQVILDVETGKVISSVFEALFG